MLKSIIYIILSLACISAGFAQAAKVQTVKDELGWRLQVDGVDFAVKGVVWDDSPIGENYTYNLFSTTEEHILQVLDTDMPLLKAMGVNTIRSFTMIPPRWVEYIFDRYGIYCMVNDLFGRYGLTVDGKWQFPTDYSNPRTRQTLLAQARKTFEAYKDTRGVLLYMLGNESNYGLDWASSAVENLPAGERSAFKAKALYSLFQEAIAIGKGIDKNHPMGLINGDLSYLKVIRDEVPDLDILGVNTYRGPQSYSAFYNSIAKDLNRPFLYTEFGADAFNATTEKEDQDAQARLLQSQWREVYDQAYAKGKAANCLGGYVFQWTDGWSKSDMETSDTFLIHDTKATWNNGGYTFDSIPGRNNMNEEWFGLAGLSRRTESGVSKRLPRTAYYLLKDLWTLDLYTSTKETIAKKFDSLAFEAASRQGNLNQLRDSTTDPLPAFVPKGSLTMRSYTKGDNEGWADTGTTSLKSAPQATLYAGFDLRGTEGLKGSFLFRILPATVGNDPAKDLFDPSETGTKLGSGALSTTPDQRIELYQATIDYRSPEFTATAHYHDGHPDWATEGDFFGLLPESFDQFHPDKGGSKTPFGVEVAFPQALPGLKVYGGPEIYWGASPRVMVKYARTFDWFGFSLMHDEEVSPGKATTSPKGDRSANRWSAAALDLNWPALGRMEGGVLLGRYAKVNNEDFKYSYFDGTNLQVDRLFSWSDALAYKVRLSSSAVPYLRAAVQYLYAGALADTREATDREGSQLNDIGTGNRSEFTAIVNAYYGDFNLRTQFLARNPIRVALTDPAAGGTARNPIDDEFVVYSNRSALQGEAVLTWDPAGATYFHDWNNVDREESTLSASLGMRYDFALGATDATYYYDGTGVMQKFTVGLPAVKGTWSLQAKASGRPLPGVKVAFTGGAGHQQSTGTDPRLVDSWKASGQVAIGRIALEGGYAANDWGSAGWYRTFNITYPTQWNLGVAYGFKPISFLTDSDRVGLRFALRELGTQGTAEEIASHLKHRFEAELYAGWTF